MQEKSALSWLFPRIRNEMHGQQNIKYCVAEKSTLNWAMISM